MPLERHINEIWGIYAYQGPLASAVHHLKFRGNSAIARPLGRLLAAFFQSSEYKAGRPECRTHYVCAVPIHPFRQFHRGYNQADLIAREMIWALSEGTIPSVSGGNNPLLPCPVYAPLLRRTKHLPPQTSLPAEARLLNVSKVFEVLPKRDLSCASITVVDDVTTTGATLLACRRALLAAGAQWVDGLALLRALS